MREIFSWAEVLANAINLLIDFVSNTFHIITIYQFFNSVEDTSIVI